MQSTLSTYCRSRLKSLVRKSHSFSYITSRILCMKLIGLHYSKITSKVTSFFARKSHLFLSVESLFILQHKKSPFTLRTRESLTAPRTSKVCLRSRAFKVLHKQNYRTFHHEKRGSDGNGNRQSELDSKRQTPHTSFVYDSSINILSASGTYHARTSSAVGVCPPGKWKERL